jgi:hypothetical protein
MKKIFSIFIIIFSFSIVNAQNSDIKYTKKYIQKINITSPGIAGETRLNSDNNITLNYNLGIKTKWDFGESGGDSRFYPSSYIFATYYMLVEVRNYFNVKNRITNKKRIEKFSGPYATFKIEYGKGLYKVITDDFRNDGYYPYYFEFGPMIGFQRAIGKIWYWDVNAGVGPSLNDYFFTFTFFSSIKFGFAF